MLRRPGIAPLVPSRNKADRQSFSVVSGVLVGQKKTRSRRDRSMWRLMIGFHAVPAQCLLALMDTYMYLSRAVPKGSYIQILYHAWH